MVKADLRVSLEGTFYVCKRLERVVDIDSPAEAILEIALTVTRNKSFDAINGKIHIFYSLQKSLEVGYACRAYT